MPDITIATSPQTVTMLVDAVPVSVPIAGSAAALLAQIARDEAAASAAAALGTLADVNAAGSSQVTAVNAAGATQITAVQTEGTTQTGLVTAAGNVATTAAAALEADSRDAKRAGLLAETALATSIPIYIPAVSGNGSAVHRFAKGYDAHATDDNDTSIKIGRVIGGVQFTAFVPAIATHVRVYVYRRATTSNVLPGGAGDVLLADSGPVTLAAAGIRTGGRAFWQVELPASQHFRVLAGYCYLGCVEYQDSASAFATVSVGPRYKTTTALAQRLAGYSHNGTAWANYTNTRPLGIGFCDSAINSVNTVKATAEARDPAEGARGQTTLLRPAERLMLRQRPWYHWKYPGTTTVASAGVEGLARIFGDNTWAAGFMKGQLGVDFGALTASGSMTELAGASPYWNAGSNRLLLGSGQEYNVPGGFGWSRVKLTGGYVDHSAPAPLSLTDFLLDANNVNLIQVFGQSGSPGRATLRNGTIRGAVNTLMSLANAEVYNSHIYYSASDLISGGGGALDAGVYLQGNLLRDVNNPAHPFYNPASHGDMIQSLNQVNWSLVGNTLYLPSAFTPYVEGGDTNNCFTMGTTGASNGVWLLGNIVGHGSYFAIGMVLLAHGASIRNFFSINNIYMGSRYGGVSGGAAKFRFDRTQGGTTFTGTIKNVGFFGDVGSDGEKRYFYSGTGALPAAGNVPALVNGQSFAIGTTAGVSWEGAEGIFNFSWADLRDKDKELLLELGRQRGEWIIDPFSRTLNSKYDLGTLQMGF